MRILRYSWHEEKAGRRLDAGDQPIEVMVVELKKDK
jgi:hypothetical protein